MSEAHPWNARRHIVIGLAALGILLAGFGGWAGFSSISGAIIASGQVAVDRNRQIVQHPDGGVVAEILVDEGDTVTVGDVLIRLDSTLLGSNADILSDQLGEIQARSARLTAERDGADTIVFPADLVDRSAADASLADVLDGQTRLFNARQTARAQEVDQLSKRRDQIANQIDGIDAQRTALALQLDLIGEELSAQQELLDKGLAQASRVLALRREDAGLRGRSGEFTATVAELRGRMTEIDIEVLKLRSQTSEAAITQLRDLQFRERELAEQLRALSEQLSRMEIRAPVAGIVYGLAVFAERAVIRPAEPVLFIIPQDRPLVILAQVSPLNIDQIYPGQDVTLRLPAFDARTTPELFATVQQVSADAFTDQTTGATFFRAEILPNDGELDRLAEGKVLLPGMPVEAFIRTADRSPIVYLFKPFLDYFNRAFREN
jgi:HlyD family type I secretion membrane fusion protein